MTAPGRPSTIEFAAARLRRQLGTRGIDAIKVTDSSLCDDDDTRDALLFFLIDEDWFSICVAAAHVPDGLTPHDMLDIVLQAAAAEPTTLH